MEEELIETYNAIYDQCVKSNKTDKVVNSLMGNVMKESRGKANPGLAKKMIIALMMEKRIEEEMKEWT